MLFGEVPERKQREREMRNAGRYITSPAPERQLQPNA